MKILLLAILAWTTTFGKHSEYVGHTGRRNEMENGK